MAEKSWKDKLRVDTRPMLRRASDDGDRMYRSIGRALGFDIDPEVGIVPGPHPEWMSGTPIAFGGIQPMGPEPAMAPFGIPLGPQPGPAVAVAKQVSKPMSKAQAADLAKALDKVSSEGDQSKADLLSQLQRPSFTISDLLPNQAAIAEAMKSAPIDIRPIASLMDSIYGTKTAQSTPDLSGEMMQKLKNAESMMGYSPALQQVLGQARLEEFKARLDEVIGSKDKALDRELQAKMLASQIAEREARRQEWEADHDIKLRKLAIDEKHSDGGSLSTDGGKPMTDQQLKNQAALDLMNKALPRLDELEKTILRTDDERENFLADAADIKFWGDVANLPVIGDFGGSFLSSLMLDGPAPKYGAPGLNSTLTPDQQVYLSEVTNFIAGKLREESGASISATEFKKEYDRYFPKSGDSPERIAHKRLLRQQEAEALRTQTGKMNQYVYRIDDKK